MILVEFGSIQFVFMSLQLILVMFIFILLISMVIFFYLTEGEEGGLYHHSTPIYVIFSCMKILFIDMIEILLQYIIDTVSQYVLLIVGWSTIYI